MITGKMFRDGIISAANNIANNRQSVDMLNVFPVPDGDTGTNMSRTIGAAAKEMLVTDDDCSLADVSQKCASALLRGARGNSGVILSLIFRGFATAFKGKEQADGKDLALAFDSGVKAAYKAVMKPTEGTILTVIRMASETATATADSNNDVFAVFNAALISAKEALEKTPEQLPVLKRAGVVDAGGQGLIFILEGFENVFNSGAITRANESDDSQQVSTETDNSVVAGASDEIEFGYCSEFLIEKADDAEKTDPLALRAYLESIGDCVVVVDDDDIIKVHVHSNQPGNVIQEGLKYGGLINIKIDNMRYQHRNAEVGVKNDEPVITPKVEPTNQYGFVAVATGDGLAELFKDIGVDVVVSGGQTMNPSTDDIVNAIDATPAQTVFVLPNNKNIIMAAEQAIPLAENRKVYVLNTKTVCQGISAMLSFDESDDEDTNLLNMTRAYENVLTAEITFAARDSEVDGKAVQKGEIMGISDGKMKFIGDNRVDVAFKTVDKLFKKDKHSIITIIYGENADETEAEEIEKKLSDKYGSDVDISIVDGGQPIYYYYISIE